MGNLCFAAFKMLCFAIICVLVIPIQLSILCLQKKGFYAYIVPRLWHGCVCLIFGIKIKRIGEISTHKQTIYVSNHISYLDIPTIASTIPEASFMAKSDVAKWPVFGFLAKLQ